MCDFCGTDDDHEKAVKNAESQAALLKRLAEAYISLARGFVIPHTDKYSAAFAGARRAAATLIEDMP